MCDMGLAKIKVGCSTITCVQIVDTPCYAAPEMCEGIAGNPQMYGALEWFTWNYVVGEGHGAVFATNYNELVKICC